MDLTFLLESIQPLIVGICLCIGYIIKTSFDFIPNKYIPLIMASLGLAMSILINKTVDANIILVGLFSGLSSTGLYEAFRNLSPIKNIEKEEDTKENTQDE